jgi:hypothetical protein
MSSTIATTDTVNTKLSETPATIVPAVAPYVEPAVAAAVAATAVVPEKQMDGSLQLLQKQVVEVIAILDYLLEERKKKKVEDEERAGLHGKEKAFLRIQNDLAKKEAEEMTRQHEARIAEAELKKKNAEEAAAEAEQKGQYYEQMNAAKYFNEADLDSWFEDETPEEKDVKEYERIRAATEKATAEKATAEKAQREKLLEIVQNEYQKNQDLSFEDRLHETPEGNAEVLESLAAKSSISPTASTPLVKAAAEKAEAEKAAIDAP